MIKTEFFRETGDFLKLRRAVGLRGIIDIVRVVQLEELVKLLWFLTLKRSHESIRSSVATSAILMLVDTAFSSALHW